MTTPRVFLVLAVATLGGSSSLLEMSQVLWSSVLNGGYSKVGKLDPLYVPVVKVDQSEGNTSYRVILKNLEVTGLNDSTIESVHIAKGRLKSNLSEHEAGYVSYNEQRDVDSIRYRFHTLVKEPKSKSKDEDESASEGKVVEYDPIDIRVGEEGDLSAPVTQGSPPRMYIVNPTFDRRYGHNRTVYGDMKVAMNATSGNPGSLHVVYSHSHKNADSRPQSKDENYRPCIGACRLYHDAQSASYASQEAARFSSSETARTQTRIYQDQLYNADRVGVQPTTTEAYAIKAQFGGSAFSAEASNAEKRPSQFSFRKGNFGISYNDDEDSQSTRETTYESQSGDVSVTPVYRVVYESTAKGNSQRQVYYGKQEAEQAGYQASSTSGYAESTTEEFNPRRNPFIRVEKQPGYIDIVYASKRDPENKSKFENLKKEDTVDDPRAYGLSEIMEELRENQRYIIHNFTEGESLKKRNDAVRVATESKRLKDLIRYAKDYQENKGYFEEGVELIYHFGDLKNSSGDSLTRRKRQHTNDKDEEDVMHVVVRIRVPKLSVKSNYVLSGKVGKQLLRGNGILAGNFTNVTADFTVELKKVNNETMIVRAARAKLTSEAREIKLQGMNEKGPVQAILSHGLMAAEGVAAMIADDLASKALNERNAEAMVFKMYKNLPAVARV